MRTSKPFATIDYNTEKFLIDKLNELVDNNTLDFWAFIEHLPEDDEKKKHKHLYFVPSKLIDTSVIAKHLEEIDLTDVTKKPLGCTVFKSSKFSDWYLYGLHDKNYLASKGQTRKYHYKKSEFFSSNEDYFNELIHTIDYSKLNRLEMLKSYIDNGFNFSQIVKSGIVPVQLINQYEKMFYMLLPLEENKINRNNKQGHEIDTDTGEILTNVKQKHNLRRFS